MAKVIARRKGNAYRTFDTVTGRMSKWQRVPSAPLAFIQGYHETAGDMTVADLRKRGNMLGLRNLSKVRKPDLLDALAVRSWSRSFDLGAVRG